MERFKEKRRGLETILILFRLGVGGRGGGKGGGGDEADGEELI